MRTQPFAITGLAITLFSAHSHAQACMWSPMGELNTSVLVLMPYNDGLLAAGQFSIVDGLAANGVAFWDGSAWSTLDSGVGGIVWAATEFNDGTGRDLYVGGQFGRFSGPITPNVARWDGEQWLGLGSGTNGRVDALAVYNDGSGPALYVGGDFTIAGGIPANNIAKWDGESWSAVGDGFTGRFPRINTLAVYDDGNGPKLFAGGQEFNINNDPSRTNRVACWDGQTWSIPGVGIDNSIVYDMQVFDDGTGEALYVSGSFLAEAPDQPGRILARWDGQTWSAPPTTPNNTAFDLSVADYGKGEQLMASGSFNAVGSEPTSFLAGWDGTQWHTFEGGNDIIWAASGGPDFPEPTLFAAGNITTIGSIDVGRIASYTCTPDCLADVNADGTLNGADFNAWLTAFNAGDDRADQNQDGTLNGADFNAWLTNFGAGCP